MKGRQNGLFRNPRGLGQAYTVPRGNWARRLIAILTAPVGGLGKPVSLPHMTSRCSCPHNGVYPRYLRVNCRALYVGTRRTERQTAGHRHGHTTRLCKAPKPDAAPKPDYSTGGARPQQSLQLAVNRQRPFEKQLLGQSLFPPPSSSTSCSGAWKPRASTPPYFAPKPARAASCAGCLGLRQRAGSLRAWAGGYSRGVVWQDVA